MRIAILAPPYLPVPPPLYGGTEKIVSLLTEGLVARGHEVTLFASGDSITTANLSSIYPKALGNSGLSKGDTSKPLAHYHACYARASEFDIIHSHGQYVSLPEAAGLKTPVVFTWHGSFYEGETTEEKRATLRKYKHLNYISISNNQRGGLPELNYVATVYNAIEMPRGWGDWGNKGALGDKGDEYLLWVGRMSPKKGVLDAILASKKLGIRLEMAAAIDPIDRQYFEETIKPHIDGKAVIYHGEISHDALVELYSGALATLYPISWHEPFGLVMVESMACGTPVIAYNIGSVPEIVRDGLTGFVIDQSEGVHGLVDAVKRIGNINRGTCRTYAEEHFHKDRMVKE
ncbi:MAG: glycosyltransferase family 4 protein, partial [Patescibacteria group bacterium]